MASRFAVVVTSMRKKPYDYLDQRKMDFDSDFDEFKRAIQELHVSRALAYIPAVILSEISCVTHVRRRNIE